GAIGRSATGRLGALADTLDLVEEHITVLLANRLPQQFAQQMDILAKARIDLGHQALLNDVQRPDRHRVRVARLATRVPSATMHGNPGIATAVLDQGGPTGSLRRAMIGKATPAPVDPVSSACLKAAPKPVADGPIPRL